MIRLHREGKATLLLVGGSLGVLNAVLWVVGAPAYVLALVGVASVLKFLFFVQFFRNPIPNFDTNEDLILSPAEGKVVVIEEVDEPEFLQTRCRQISIFMSPFNVHVNRNPIAGQVEYVKYHPGKYLVAWHPKSSTENERTTVSIRHPRHGSVLFRQIAGALARRICYYVAEGQAVAQGEEMGFIKFGSRVDVFVPLSAKVRVQIGQQVKGTEVLASF
ncbi:MAG: phosphatidylserine decarboxylase family protein [Bernardetiaceae bacterium]